MRRIYDETIATRDGSRFVSTVVNDHFSALCPTIVLDDGAEAFRIGSRGQRFFAEAIDHWYGGGGPPDERLDVSLEEDRAAMTADRAHLVARLHEARIPVTPHATGIYSVDHAFGTATDAVAYVERLAEAGADEVMCLVQMGTVPAGGVPRDHPPVGRQGHSLFPVTGPGDGLG